MINNSSIIFFLIIIVSINTLLLGYLLVSFLQNGVSNKHKSFFNQKNSLSKENNSITVNDKIFIVDIKTEGLEKKFNVLGDIKTTDEDISGSINKLKNLKR